MDTITARLAEYAAGLRFDDLPSAVVELAVARVVDSLGCAVGGLGSEQARIALAVSPRVESPGSDDPAGMLIGQSWTTTLEHAAFANTCLIRNLDFNDRYPSIHPADMIGGLLAAAATPGLDGRRLVTAVVAAYEVGTRIADAIRRSPGWDGGYPTGMGTVAGLANLFGCDSSTTAEALALVATANVHLRSTRAGALSMWKGAATAHATYNAMFLIRLARRGMTGPERPIEGRHGLWEQMTGEFTLPPLPDQGGEHLIAKTSLKYWPVEYSAQNAVWAASQLAGVIPIDRLESVRIGMHTHGWREIGSDPAKWDPRSRETADHSLPYVFVRALQGDGVDLSIFEPEQYLDPAARPLMAKVVVEADPRCDAVHPDGVMLTCDAVATDGRTESFVVQDPRGFWTNPMDEAEVAAKFHGLVDARLGAGRADALLDFWGSLPGQTDLVTGLRLLA